MGRGGRRECTKVGRGRTQVDRESSNFDMTMADSREDDIPRVEEKKTTERVQDSDGAEDTPSTCPVRRLALVQSQHSSAVPEPTPIPNNPGFEGGTETVDGASMYERGLKRSGTSPPIVTGPRSAGGVRLFGWS